MVKNVGRKFSLRKLVYQADIRGCDIEYICTYTCRSEFDGKIYDRKTVLSHWSLQISSPSPWGLRSAVEFTNIISVIIFKFKEDIQPRPGAFGWTRGRIFTEIYAVKRLATVSERAKLKIHSRTSFNLDLNIFSVYGFRKKRKLGWMIRANYDVFKY